MHNLPHDGQSTLTCALSTPREPLDIHNSPAPFCRIFLYFFRTLSLARTDILQDYPGVYAQPDCWLIMLSVELFPYD